MIVTFIATLALPVAAAVAVGLICSLLLQLNKEQMDLRVVRLEPIANGRLASIPRPSPSRTPKPLVLDVYGSLLYAGARTLGARLPDPHGVRAPGGVLRLRGRTSLGSTFFGVVAGYADALAESGWAAVPVRRVQPDMIERFHRSQVQDARARSSLRAPPRCSASRPWRPCRTPARWLVGQQRRHDPGRDGAPGAVTGSAVLTLPSAATVVWLVGVPRGCVAAVLACVCVRSRMVQLRF